MGVCVDSTEETEIDDWLIWFNEEKVQSNVSNEILRDLEKQKNESVIWSFEEKEKHRQTPRVKVFRCFSQLTNENEEIQISLSLKSFVPRASHLFNGWSAIEEDRRDRFSSRLCFHLHRRMDRR